MTYLLDTHAFLWFINADKQLSAKAKKSILDINAINYISIASLWEIAIKVSIKKLDIGMSFLELKNHVTANGFEILPVTFEHTLTVSTLDFHHRDPFDRIIAAQSIVESFTLISKDPAFQKYEGLQVLWQ